MADDLPAFEKLVRINDVLELTALSRASVYRAISAGQFPQPVRISGASRWPISEIMQFIEEKKAARAPVPKVSVSPGEINSVGATKMRKH